MQWDTVHVVIALVLAFVAGMMLPVVVYGVQRVYRKTENIEGITAAIYLEARKVLSQYRPPTER